MSHVIDIDETDSEFIVNANLPGINEEDIVLKAEGSGIEIHALGRILEMKIIKGEPSFEGTLSSYEKYVELSDEADFPNMEANKSGDWLEIRIPKKAAQS